jgi:hypothetical protein
MKGAIALNGTARATNVLATLVTSLAVLFLFVN